MRRTRPELPPAVRIWALVFLSAAGLCRTASAQTAVNLETQSKNINFTLLGNTRPFAMGASLPGTCIQGAMFFLTSATAGENVYGCASTNVWSLQGGSGSTPAVWGGITGTLSNQGDLSTALASKPTAALVTSIGTPGSDTNVPSEKAVRTLATAISEGAGTAWGMITGTLSSQTDLAAALAGKQASLGFTPENAANKDAHSGYAGLDSNGLLKTAEAPVWNQNTTGSAANAAAIGGVTVTGTPSVGYVPIATSSTAAAWGPQSGGGGGGGGVWGSITGMLANQTDLESALTARVAGTLVTSLGNPGTNGNVPTEEAVRSAIAALAPVWGGITGTLSSQTDLESALNSKPTGALVGTIGTPGSNTNIPSEEAVRTAITAAQQQSTGITFAVGGTTAGIQETLNFISGNGIVQSCANNASLSRVDCTPSLDTAYATSRATDQAGTDRSILATSGGVGTSFVANGAPTFTSYTTNQTLSFIPSDHDCAAAATLNIDTLGPIAIQKMVAGALTALSAGDCKQNIPYLLLASGSPVSAFRLLDPENPTVATVEFCGTATTCAATGQSNARMVYGSAPLVSGAPSTATVTSISPAFASSSTYVCTVTAESAPAGALFSVANVSGSSFTITGPAAVTTVMNYICVGT